MCNIFSIEFPLLLLITKDDYPLMFYQVFGQLAPILPPDTVIEKFFWAL